MRLVSWECLSEICGNYCDAPQVRFMYSVSDSFQFGEESDTVLSLSERSDRAEDMQPLFLDCAWGNVNILIRNSLVKYDHTTDQGYHII